MAEQAFQTWMRQRFSNVGQNPGTMGYTIAGPQGRTVNCIAHAIGQTNVRITPPNKAGLDEVYLSYGFYQVPTTGDPRAGDAEVYAKPSATGIPLHAHRVEGATRNVMTCSSKMGDDFLIRHPRALLQCTRAGSNQYEYGNVQYRYRFDAAKFKVQEASKVKTRSGRVVKQSETVLTKSNSRIMKSDATRTKSNRITKKSKVVKK
ncbi:hypothetical protein Daus18300_004562 [Diaporthe australafricana]|uniref:DUF7689 domain-containing protein n=1 Tax=Diaporthe australafricana TaxID=127596 RepID=A0ABR3X7K2_9PEZI